MPELKKKGPSDSRLWQQKIPVVQLVYTPTCVGVTFFATGIVALMLGLVLYFYAAQVVEVSGTYAGTSNSICKDTAKEPCQVPIVLDKDMPGPVFFYYTLTNFYSNHRRFVNSRSDAMNRGTFDESDPTLRKDGTTLVETCEGFDSYYVNDKRIFYYPCGLVARSLFNDSFQLSSTSDNIAWTKQGISGGGNTIEKKFKSKDSAWLKKNCYRYGPLDGSQDFKSSNFPAEPSNFSGTNDATSSGYDCWHFVEDEDLVVWMKTSMDSNFWKLHRIYRGDLKKGVYQLTINLNYPVAGFDGTKGYVLTNATPFGGKRSALAVVYLVIGSFSLFFSFVAVLLGTKKVAKPEVKYPPDNIPDAPPAAAKSASSSSKTAGAAAAHTHSDRTVIFPVSNEPNAQKYLTNFVSTTKYSMISFVPKNLFLQFQRFANVYFLVVAILASIPQISPLGASTFWVPLLSVLMLSAMKDAKEDYNRYLSDVEENSRITMMYDHAERKFAPVPWHKVEVGSLVMVVTGEDSCSPMIPSDLALIASSAEDGTAFVETANLDGETNLKLREAPSETQKLLTTAKPQSVLVTLNESQLPQLKLKVSCGEPDAFLYDFNGRLQIANDGKDIPLNGGSSGGQFLQRSTKLKNTKWILGVTVYTGKETKIQMNMNDPPNKVSNVEQMLNTYIPGIAVLLFVLCLIGAILAGAWQATNQVRSAWYLQPASETPTFNVNNPAYAGFLVFFSHLVLLSLLIPISLYVSIEFVKFFIAEVISSDREMYAVEDDIPSKARSAGLCEELGQVNYIFSDKTGTLTQNLMEFKKCSIAGIEYGQGFCEVERAIARRQGRVLPEDPKPPAGMDPGFRFVDNRLLKGAWEKEGQAQIIEGFLMHLALNHTVQVEYKGDMPLFQAESPDEGAFVAAARNLGFSFCRRNMKDIFLRVQDWKSSQVVGSGVEKRWTILNVNPFDNNRKRTSVVVEDEAGKKLLLVKGADTSIMPFVDHGRCPFFTETQKHIDKFGDQGLRTLAFAGRELSDADYVEWNKRFTQASLLSQGREDALRQAASEIEECHADVLRQSAIFDSSTPYTASLVLHGVTALEDKLQENVGNCIAQLAKAMIKIWVLTGDKLETAINIGFATALLATEMEPLLRVSQDEMARAESTTDLERELHAAIEAAATRESAKLRELEAGLRDKTGEHVDAVRASLKRVGGGADAAGELSTLESRLRELLLRERVRKAVASFEEQTRLPRAGGYALIIDGPCLRAAMHPGNKWTFLKLGLRCKAVVCCRVTPAQKAEVTLLVKDNVPGKITLAIGDGANDVSMIQAAHVGVGIRGKEGQQAVLASDYALPRFAYLERLLLIHGRWSYNRIGTLVGYFFYKNIAFVMTLFWFSLTNGYSAQALFDSGYQSLYNLVFTSWPVMIFAGLDRDLEAHHVLALPELYSTGQFRVRFNARRFGLFVGGAMAHSLLLFFVTRACLDLNVSDRDARVVDVWSGGTSVFTNVVGVVTVVMGLHTRSFTWIHWLFYVGSFGVWFLFLVVYCSVPPGYLGTYDTADKVYNILFDFGSSILFWLTLIALVLLCCLPILLWKFLKEHLFPDIDDYYRRNLPKDNQMPAISLSPAEAEAPPSPVAALLPPAAAAPPAAADRNKEPSLLEHVRSRSDFTPAPPHPEDARSGPASETSRSHRRDIL